MDDLESAYPCVGVCMLDADGYCLGCGRPPLPIPDAEASDAPPPDERNLVTESTGVPQ